MKLLACIVATWGLIQQALAEDYAFDADHWEFAGEVADRVEYKGQTALHLKNAEARLKGLTLKDGVIAFDIAFSEQRSFAGVFFRQFDERNAEYFYFRPHQSGNPDANQYTPLFNGSSAWQIYYGPQYSAPTPYRFNEWMHVEIRIKDDRTEVHLDGEPILHIADLLNATRSGGVVLRAFLGDHIYVANVSVQARADVVFEGEPTQPPTMPAGTVRTWLVSEPFARARLDGVHTLADADLDALSWQRLAVETNGIANLARVAVRSDDRDTVFARLVVETDAEWLARIRFGYSDSVRVYVNSRPVYSGDNTYRSRDYRYLGTVGLFDSIHASLNPGRNEIVFAVTEAFGGWAIAAALDEDNAGRTIRP